MAVTNPKNSGNNTIDSVSDTPRIVVCVLGEENWFKAAQDLILVNSSYVEKVERNRQG